MLQSADHCSQLSDAYIVLNNSSMRVEYDEWLRDVEATVKIPDKSSPNPDDSSSNPDGSSPRQEGGCKCYYCSMHDKFDDEPSVHRIDRHLREARWKGCLIPKTDEEVLATYEELMQEYEELEGECAKASLQYEIDIRNRSEPDDPRPYIKARVVFMRAEEIEKDLERLKNPTKNVEWMGEQYWIPSTKFCRATSPKEIESDPDEIIIVSPLPLSVLPDPVKPRVHVSRFVLTEEQDPWGDQFWNEWFWEDFAAREAKAEQRALVHQTPTNDMLGLQWTRAPRMNKTKAKIEKRRLISAQKSEQAQKVIPPSRSESITKNEAQAELRKLPFEQSAEEAQLLVEEHLPRCKCRACRSG